MAVHETLLRRFIADEVNKVKGAYLPVHAGKIERILVRKVSCKKLHPNPNDEFCFPEIGPNEEIISNYERDYRILLSSPNAHIFLKSNVWEPLDVQKIKPDGYMILNGHHRWAAAVRAGASRIPVRIVNLTQESDIRRMLEHSKHEKRVTLDLEEAVFSGSREEETEKPLRFPFNRIYRERLRMGIPALFAALAVKGYDIWLYSSGYVSEDYIRDLLKLYHVRVTGIVTGTARKEPENGKTREKLESLMNGKYHQTIHIDKELVLCIDHRTKDYREFPLKGSAFWSAEIMEIIGAAEKNG